MKQEFEWDKTKAETNQRKHKVSFDEAITVFDDPFLLTFPDPAHSYDEERKISIGASDQGQILVVIHTDRDNRIRLISCRAVTARERKVYEEGEF